MIDLKTCELTEAECWQVWDAMTWGLMALPYSREREEAVLRAQLAKLLLGPDGIVAWLKNKARRLEEMGDRIGAATCLACAADLEQAARAAGLEWPMK